MHQTQIKTKKGDTYYFLNSKKEEETDFTTRTRESNPGNTTQEALTDPPHLRIGSCKFRFFLTLNTTSLCLCNTGSPKPQNEC